MKPPRFMKLRYIRLAALEGLAAGIVRTACASVVIEDSSLDFVWSMHIVDNASPPTCIVSPGQSASGPNWPILEMASNAPRRRTCWSYLQ